MEKLIKILRVDYPELLFSPGLSHCWMPEQGQISYSSKETPHGLEGLLHELGHAKLKHTGYSSDMELLKKEVDAWEEAAKLAAHYGCSLNNDHIQDCLDTYRDWLHKRSSCPICRSTGIQLNEKLYLCLNCGDKWQVSPSRFCRPYRMSAVTKKTTKSI